MCSFAGTGSRMLPELVTSCMPEHYPQPLSTRWQRFLGESPRRSSQCSSLVWHLILILSCLPVAITNSYCSRADDDYCCCLHCCFCCCFCCCCCCCCCCCFEAATTTSTQLLLLLQEAVNPEPDTLVSVCHLCPPMVGSSSTNCVAATMASLSPG